MHAHHTIIQYTLMDVLITGIVDIVFVALNMQNHVVIVHGYLKVMFYASATS